MSDKCGYTKRNGKKCTAKGWIKGRCKRHTPEKTGEKDFETASRIPLKEVKKSKAPHFKKWKKAPVVGEAYGPSVAADFAQSLCTLITVMVQQELQKMLANATITTKVV